MIPDIRIFPRPVRPRSARARFGTRGGACAPHLCNPFAVLANTTPTVVIQSAEMRPGTALILNNKMKTTDFTESTDLE